MNEVVTHRDDTRPSHVRWVIVASLFWVSMSNFLDRSVFGNLAPEMPKYLHLANAVTPAEIDRYWQTHSNEFSIAAGANSNQMPDALQNYIREQIARNK